MDYMADKWTQQDERNWTLTRALIRKFTEHNDEPPEWLTAEYADLDASRKAAKPRRRKGDSGLYQRADGMWCVSVELPNTDGKRRRKTICRKDKGDVMSELRAAKKELEKLGDLQTSSITLNDWAKTWLERIAPKDIKPRTLAGYRTVINGYILPTLGKKPLGKITAQDVRRLHDTMAATPKDPKLRDVKDLPADTVMLSSTYILLAHNALSVMLNAATQEGHLSSNPCDVVSRPRKRKLEQQALTLKQAIELLRHVLNRENGALWACSLLTGARRGEVIGLEWDRVTDVLDLSWQLQRITNIKDVPDDFEYRQVKSTLYLTRPKSSSGWRIIPLVEPLKSILELHRQTAPSGDDGFNLVFREGAKPWDPDRVTKAWKALMRETQLPEDVVLHGARHTAVDLLYAAKVPEDLIQAIVGHSTRAMTRSYKTRVDTDRAREGMQALSALLHPQIEP